MYSWLLRNALVPLFLKATGSRFWNLYHEMLALETRPRSELAELQWTRCRELLEHAYRTVPYYRDRMDDLGIQPEMIATPADLTRLPITTKADIQRNFPDRMVDSTADRSQWRYVSTGGTANRLIAIHDFGKRDMARAATLRSLRLSGNYRVGKRMVEIPPDACNLFCGNEGQSNDGVFRHVWRTVREGRWRDRAAISDLRGQMEIHWFFCNKVYPPIAPDGTEVSWETLDACLADLRRDRPYILKALPTYLYMLARHVERTGAKPPRVNVIKPMGASVSPGMREVIRKGFDGEYREDYGSSELGGMACDCDERDGLHVFMDLFVIEVLRDGHPVRDGERGQIVVTDLSNRAMPLIRYQIGDVGRMTQEPCACGRSTPRLFIDGRLEDTIVNSNGQMITSDQVTDLVYRHHWVDAFQLLEDQPGKFSLLVVANDAGPSNVESLLGELKVLLEDDVEIKPFTVRSIKPETGGKFRPVKSATYQRLDHASQKDLVS